MSLERELRLKVVATPDDAGAWQVFADHVEEAGYPERAAVVRAEMARRMTPRDDPEWLAICADLDAAREAADVAPHGESPDEIPRHLLLTELEYKDFSWFSENGAAWLSEHPIEILGLSRRDDGSPVLPDLEGVRDLRLSGPTRPEGFLPRSLERLVTSGPNAALIEAAAALPALASLTLTDPIDAAISGLITELPLRGLGLSSYQPSQLEALPPTLERLLLRYGDLDSDSIDRLFARGPALTDLILDYNPIDNVMFTKLLHSLDSSRLERLSLARTNITDRSVKRLCDHPVIERLTELDLSGNGFTKALEHLARSGARRLRALGISGTSLASRGLKELVESPVSDSLVLLDIYGTTDPEALDLLLEPETAPKLRWITGYERVYWDDGLDVPSAFPALRQRFRFQPSLAINPMLWTV